VFEENEVEVDNDVFEFENKIKTFEGALATMNLEMKTFLGYFRLKAHYGDSL
jgi:hypothetical protein